MTLNEFLEKLERESAILLLKELAKEHPIVEFNLREIAKETLREQLKY